MLSLAGPRTSAPGNPASDSGSNIQGSSNDPGHHDADSFQQVLRRTSEESRGTDENAPTSTGTQGRKDKETEGAVTRPGSKPVKSNTKKVLNATDLPTPPVPTAPQNLPVPVVPFAAILSCAGAGTEIPKAGAAPAIGSTETLATQHIQALDVLPPVDPSPVSELRSAQSQLTIPQPNSALQSALLQKAGAMLSPSKPEPPENAKSRPARELTAVDAITPAPIPDIPAAASTQSPPALPMAPESISLDRSVAPESAAPLLAPKTVAFTMRLTPSDGQQAPRPSQSVQAVNSAAINGLSNTQEITVSAALLNTEPDASKNHSSGSETSGGGYFESAIPTERTSPEGSAAPTSNLQGMPSSEAAANTVAPSSEPVRNLLLQLKGEDNRRVDVRLVDRGGELHVSVKAGDAELAQTLQEHMPELTSRLDAERLTAEVWLPQFGGSMRTESGASQSLSQQDASSFQSGRNNYPSSGQQNQRQGQPRPDWADVLEDQIS